MVYYTHGFINLLNGHDKVEKGIKKAYDYHFETTKR